MRVPADELLACAATSTAAAAAPLGCVLTGDKLLALGRTLLHPPLLPFLLLSPPPVDDSGLRAPSLLHLALLLLLRRLLPLAKLLTQPLGAAALL
jgi:hypothetical protein